MLIYPFICYFSWQYIHFFSFHCSLFNYLLFVWFRDHLLPYLCHYFIISFFFLLSIAFKFSSAGIPHHSCYLRFYDVLILCLFVPCSSLDTTSITPPLPHTFSTHRTLAWWSGRRWSEADPTPLEVHRGTPPRSTWSSPPWHPSPHPHTCRRRDR